MSGTKTYGAVGASPGPIKGSARKPIMHRRRHTGDWGSYPDVHFHPAIPKKQPRVEITFEDSKESCSTEKMLPMWRLGCIGALGFSVEFCWAVSEALIIPYLLNLNLPVELAGLVWLANPMVTVFLQPLMGQWSDNCSAQWGRRRPFIFWLTILGVMGMGLLVFSKQVLGDSHPKLIIGVGFVSFAMADVAHNCLLGFGRVLVGDIVDSEQVDIAHATFTMLQMVGRLMALLSGCINLEIAFPFLTSDPHSQALFFLCVFVLLVCSFLTCVSAIEVPLESSSEDEDEGLLGSRYSKSLRTDNDSSDGDEEESMWNIPAPMFNLLLLLLIGWVALMAQAFYWTEWIGLERVLPGTNIHKAFVGLTAYAVASLLTVLALPFLNNHISPLIVLIWAELLIMGAMLVSGYVDINNLWQTGAVAVVSGMGYAVHNNNPYVLVELWVDEDDEDQDRRGFLGSLVNSTLTLGQIIVGAFAGLCIKKLDGSISNFFAMVGLGGILALMAIGLHHIIMSFYQTKPSKL